jgi:acetolactate synthase-1/2/3 large subunit
MTAADQTGASGAAPAADASTNGAGLLAQAIRASGTSVLFSLSGNQIMPLYDACLDADIRIVHVRHENAAVFMADAWGQLRVGADKVPHNSARCGVALVTAGPGFANALGGLYSALMAETPLVLLSGDSPVTSDSRRTFQEFPQTIASAPFVKHAERVTSAEELALAWHRCVDIALSGRPGPVHLALPFDVLQATAPAIKTLTPKRPVKSDDSTDHAQLAGIARALRKAERPIVITGPALSRSRLSTAGVLQQSLGIPVVTMESPRGLGDPSLGRIADVLKDADCLVLLGKHPDFTLAFGAPDKLSATTLCVVDADAVSLQQSMNVLEQSDAIGAQQNQRQCIAVHMEPTRVIDYLCANAIRAEDHQAWLQSVGDLLSVKPLIGNDTTTAASHAADATVTPMQIGSAVQAVIDQHESSIVVCDGGEFGQWAQACIRSKRRIINGPSGAIGGSLPQAIAAKIASPESIVFALMGDGTAGFHLAELETSVRERAPVIVLIGNDSRWNAEYQIQYRDYGADRLHSCELGDNVRYDVAAEGLGCAGALVTTEAQLVDALAEAVQRCEAGVSTCINVTMQGWPAPVFPDPR